MDYAPLIQGLLIIEISVYDLRWQETKRPDCQGSWDALGDGTRTQVRRMRTAVSFFLVRGALTLAPHLPAAVGLVNSDTTDNRGRKSKDYSDYSLSSTRVD